jgi:soluble lytic murein transglycosylase-like protein
VRSNRFAATIFCTRGIVAVGVIHLIAIMGFATVAHVVLSRMAGKYVAEVAEVKGTAPREAIIPTVPVTRKMQVAKYFRDLEPEYGTFDTRRIREQLKPWNDLIEHYSKRYGVDPDLVRAIMYAESRCNPDTVSSKGALGLMQIMPSTGSSLGIEDLTDPALNIECGVRYIAMLGKGLDERQTLWAWNAGPARINMNVLPEETQNFIERVISVKSCLKKAPAI